MRDRSEPVRGVRRLSVRPVAAESPMQVQVRFYGIRRELTNEPYVELRVPQGSSLRKVLNALVERFGERVRRHLFSADGAYLRDMLCVTVNGYIVGDAELDAPLPAQPQGKQRVDVSVIFAIAGG